MRPVVTGFLWELQQIGAMLVGSADVLHGMTQSDDSDQPSAANIHLMQASWRASPRLRHSSLST